MTVRITSILVPTDFSESSQRALEYALAFAESFGSQVHLLHTVEDPYAYPWAAEAYASPRETMERFKDEAHARLATLVPESWRERVRVVVAVEVGSPLVQVLDYAAAHAIDLIVMGTHGRGPVAHLLLGSVAENVVRRARCAVLTVRHPGHTFIAP